MYMLFTDANIHFHYDNSNISCLFLMNTSDMAVFLF